MIFTVEMVIEVHERIIATTGGLEGIKDIAILDFVIDSIIQPTKDKRITCFQYCHIKE